jgi:hypothetical protein
MPRSRGSFADSGGSSSSVRSGAVAMRELYYVLGMPFDRASARIALIACVLLPVCAANADAQECTAQGYLLAASTNEPLAQDSAYLQSMAHALAYRWPVPSKRRDGYGPWRRVRRRALPPAPRWADDYTPSDQLRAQFVIVIPRRGRPRVLDSAVNSGDEVFDRSLRLMVTDPLPASPDLPPFPASVTADSIAITVHLGAVPDSVRAGRIRFAAIQRPVELVPGTLEFVAPRGGFTAPASQRFATVKYDVNVHGQVVPSSIEILESSDRELANAVRSALVSARYRAADQDCGPVTISVVQTFRG